MEIMIGADPEVFVKQGGVNVSGHAMIPGTKKAPHPVEKGAVQVDGTALEFNIDPAKTEEEFVTNCRAVLAQLKAMIPADAEIDLSAVARYEEAYFRDLPDFVKALGCDPDFDAYTGVETERRAAERPFRTAAGHIHIGWTKDEDPFKARHFQSCRTLTKELDIWLGLPSVIFDAESKDRRDLYGKAGCFRPKPYGCEYRVLSNKWLQSDEMTKWAFAQTKRAFDWLMTGNPPMHKTFSEKRIQQAINTSDVDTAKGYLSALGCNTLLMPDGSNFVPKAAAPKRLMAKMPEVQWKKIREAADPVGLDGPDAILDAWVPPARLKPGRVGPGFAGVRELAQAQADREMLRRLDRVMDERALRDEERALYDAAFNRELVRHGEARQEEE